MLRSQYLLTGMLEDKCNPRTSQAIKGIINHDSAAV